MSGNSSKIVSVPMPAKAMPANVVLRGSRPRRCVKPNEPISRETQRFAAAILEVLAGVRTPADAAAALSVSVPRYYLWEQRALEGLVTGCKPRPTGRAASERHEIAVLQKEVVRLKQDCARYQALVRASQRTIGLAASPPPAAKPAGKSSGKTAGKARRKRRPVARALKAVAALQTSPDLSESLADSSSAVAADVLQQSVPSSLSQTDAAAGAAAAVSEA
jgi:hypothetical protein